MGGTNKVKIIALYIFKRCFQKSAKNKLGYPLQSERMEKSKLKTREIENDNFFSFCLNFSSIFFFFLLSFNFVMPAIHILRWYEKMIDFGKSENSLFAVQHLFPLGFEIEER